MFAVTTTTTTTETATRLENEFEFLYNLLLTQPATREYREIVTHATIEQLKALFESVINIDLFCNPLKSYRKLSNRLKAVVHKPSDIIGYLLQYERLVREILSVVISSVAFGECILLLCYNPEEDTSSDISDNADHACSRSNPVPDTYADLSTPSAT